MSTPSRDGGPSHCRWSAVPAPCGGRKGRSLAAVGRVRRPDPERINVSGSRKQISRTQVIDPAAVDIHEPHSTVVTFSTIDRPGSRPGARQTVEDRAHRDSFGISSGWDQLRFNADSPVTMRKTDCFGSCGPCPEEAPDRVPSATPSPQPARRSATPGRSNSAAAPRCRRASRTAPAPG